MSFLHFRILKSIKAFCLYALALLLCPSVQAQFVPAAGVRSSRWKAPSMYQGVDDFYWLLHNGSALDNYSWRNDRELIYTATPQAQYVQRNLITGKEHVLDVLTKLVGRDETLPWGLPHVYPSPNGKYLAWILRANTLMIATTGGSIISQRSYPTPILYPSWSKDSQYCFCFVEGQVADDIFADYTAFTAISAVNLQTPSTVREYPLESYPLSGSLGIRMNPGGVEDPTVADFHFRDRNHIVLITPFLRQHDPAPSMVRFIEYNLDAQAKPVETHIMKMPASLTFGKAVFSPQGDKIAWILDNDMGVEIWISDKTGDKMVRLGGYPRLTTGSTGDNHDFKMKWLPSGKGISLREAEEMYLFPIPVQTRRNDPTP